MPSDRVRLEVSGPPIDPAHTGQPFLYAVPGVIKGSNDGGISAQAWSMLGREDRSAASGSAEYQLAVCPAIQGYATGLDQVVEAIVEQAAKHRVVILNESHALTRHREVARILLGKLKPLGFTVFAAETFTNLENGQAPVVKHSHLAWPHQYDGFYSSEPIFGRLVREAKTLKYKLAAYEQLPSPAASPSASGGDEIQIREAEQVRHLSAILGAMRPEERLFIYVGYSHAKEVPQIDSEGRELEWMAAGLKRMTGLDPLTIAQTVCRGGSEAFLAAPPAKIAPGSFDMIISHPVESFVDHRPVWRREAGDLPVAIPESLRPVGEPLVIEAFAFGEPFDSVPVDRVLVEAGEKVPLLLPPGRYRVRAVRTSN